MGVLIGWFVSYLPSVSRIMGFPKFMSMESNRLTGFSGSTETGLRGLKRIWLDINLSSP